jgi:hypothetical protein
MAIPESQLETWSKQGAVAQSRDTYGSIKSALEDANAPYATKDFNVFLQGSYCNYTNVYAESDVDIVIRCDDFFSFDLDDLTSVAKSEFHKAFPAATYGLSDFKNDVATQLKKKYGESVKHGTKAIYIRASGSRREADVIVAGQHRRYYSFNNVANQRYADGIYFETSNRGRIINFPKQHSENCTSKHQNTNGWFKPTIRIFKNMRNRMVADGLIENGVAPSYFIEGLLYNVPLDKFGTSYEDTFVSTFNYVIDADRGKFVCANQMYYLLGNSNVTWPSTNCDQFLNTLSEFWTNW